MRALRAALSASLPLITGISFSQVLAPSVVATAGGTLGSPQVILDQSVGEPVIATFSTSTLRLTQGFEQGSPARVLLRVRLLLQGPFDSGTGLMNDALRTGGYLPLLEPYSAMGLGGATGGGEQTTPAVLQAGGPDAIVDWVHLELRAQADPTHIVAHRNALLQRDGDVVDVDGVSPVAFTAPPAAYFISVHHRDHLAVMTAAPISLSTLVTTIDLSDGSMAAEGAEAMALAGAHHLLWCGDVDHDGTLRYTGSGNDRDPILLRIGGTTPNNVTSGYYAEDVNMDGTVRYTGAENDRDAILLNIGGTTPNAVRISHVP